MYLQNTVRRPAAQPVEQAGDDVAGLSIGERIVSALCDALELLGQQLGGAVLMQQHWLNAGAPLTPSCAPRDEA